jgi:ketosteroid isomerase-like protein
MKIHRINALAMLLVAAAGSCIAASDAESIAAVKKGEETLRQSLMKRDTKTLAKLMTDDFVRIPPATPATPRAEYFSILESGRLQYLSFEVDDAQFRAYGDTVIVQALVHLRTRSGDDRPPAESHLRLLNVWVKQNGEWRLATIQGNQAPTPPRQ